jgi:hypothetical protein
LVVCDRSTQQGRQLAQRKQNGFVGKGCSFVKKITTMHSYDSTRSVNPSESKS